MGKWCFHVFMLWIGTKGSIQWIECSLKHTPTFPLYNLKLYSVSTKCCLRTFSLSYIRNWFQNICINMPIFTLPFKHLIHNLLFDSNKRLLKLKLFVSVRPLLVTKFFFDKKKKVGEQPSANEENCLTRQQIIDDNFILLNIF